MYIPSAQQRPRHWSADGTLHSVNQGGIYISVKVDNINGKINPNLASSSLLDGLFIAIGTPRDNAEKAANSIVEWRTPIDEQSAQKIRIAYRQAGLPYASPGRSFEDLIELADVSGMQHVVLLKAMPF